MVAKMNSSKIFKWLKNGSTGKIDDSKIKQTNKQILGGNDTGDDTRQ